MNPDFHNMGKKSFFKEIFTRAFEGYLNFSVIHNEILLNDMCMH